MPGIEPFRVKLSDHLQNYLNDTKNFRARRNHIQFLPFGRGEIKAQGW